MLLTDSHFAVFSGIELIQGFLRVPPFFVQLKWGARQFMRWLTKDRILRWAKGLGGGLDNKKAQQFCIARLCNI